MRVSAGDSASAAFCQPAVFVSDGPGRENPHRQYPPRDEGWRVRRDFGFSGTCRSGAVRSGYRERLATDSRGGRNVRGLGYAGCMALASRLPVAAATDRSVAGSAVVRPALAERPDVVVVDFPHADVLMPARIKTASVMFTHNVEAEIFERHAERESGIWRLLWADQSRKMERLEQESLVRYDTVVAVSARDRDVLARRLWAAEG